jgi:hypothetical protein
VQLTRTGVLLSHFPVAALKARLRALPLIFISWMLLVAARVEAEPSSVLLVSDSDVPASIERSVKRRLGQVADVEENRGAAPGSDAAFSKIAARAGAALIVSLRMTSDSELLAELRDAGSGAVLSTHSFAVQGRRLKQATRALRELVSSTREQMSRSGARPANTHAQEAAGESELDEEVAAPAPEPQSASAHEAVEASIQPVQSGDEQIMDDPELSARLAASPSDGDPGPRQGLALQASVGIGPGVHALNVPAPSMGGGSGSANGELDTGLAPAAALSAAAELGLGAWMVRAEAQYRTFFGVESAPLPSDPSGMSPGNAATSGSALTSHSFVIGASPGYRFGGRNSAALLLMLGWTYRALHASASELPGVSLTGLVIRPALQIPFGDGVFCLRIAPELVVVQGSQTNAQGFMPTQASGGVGWGAEAAVDVRLAKLLGAGLQYRRSRIAATRNSGGPAIDEEWYVAIQAVLSL